MTDQEQKQLPPAFDVDKLDGVDKAAILLLSLSEEDSGFLSLSCVWDRTTL